MARPKKENVAPESAEPKEGMVFVQVGGAAPVRFDGVIYVPGDVFDLAEDKLDNKGIRHLFVTGQLQFQDNPKRTRELLADIKLKPKEKELTEKEAETGSTVA